MQTFDDGYDCDSYVELSKDAFKDGEAGQVAGAICVRCTCSKQPHGAAVVVGVVVTVVVLGALGVALRRQNREQGYERGPEKGLRSVSIRRALRKGSRSSRRMWSRVVERGWRWRVGRGTSAAPPESLSQPLLPPDSPDRAQGMDA